MKYSGIIFDMDGLIIDTERYSEGICKELYEEMNVPWDPELYLSLIGVGPKEEYDIMMSYFKKEETVRYVQQEFAKRIKEALLKGLVPLKPGAVELITYLKQQQIPYILATSSPRERVEAVFDSSEFKKNPFDKVVTAADVERGKPYPDIFLKGAELLGLSPQKCIVLEDSIAGVTAGIAAECTTIMVVDIKEPTKEIEKNAFAIKRNLYEVIELLKENDYEC